MNYLWAFMILTGIIYGAFHGTLPQITTAAARFGKRGGYALYYHDGSDVFLGGTDADCGKGGDH